MEIVLLMWQNRNFSFLKWDTTVRDCPWPHGIGLEVRPCDVRHFRSSFHSIPPNLCLTFNFGDSMRSLGYSSKITFPITLIESFVCCCGIAKFLANVSNVNLNCHQVKFIWVGFVSMYGICALFFCYIFIVGWCTLNNLFQTRINGH